MELIILSAIQLRAGMHGSTHAWRGLWGLNLSPLKCADITLYRYKYRGAKTNSQMDTSPYTVHIIHVEHDHNYTSEFQAVAA